MIQVYVSYAVPDIRYAMKVEDTLAGKGCQLWLADVPDHARLQEMDLVLAIVTSASLSRSQTIRDWTLANGRGRLLVLECEDRPLPAFMQDAVAVRYGDPGWEQELRRAVQEVAALPLRHPSEPDQTTTQVVPDWGEVSTIESESDMLPIPAGKYAHIFLAAAESDRVMARRVVSDFRRSGMLALLEPPTWQTALLSSVCMVVLLTPDAPGNETLARYLRFAGEQAIPVYPALARGTYESATPELLTEHSYTDLQRDYRRGMMQIVKKIQQHI